MANPVSASGSQGDHGVGTQVAWESLQAVDDDTFVAYAAVIISARVPRLSAQDAVEWLYNVADDVSVDCVALARLIVTQARVPASCLN